MQPHYSLAERSAGSKPTRSIQLVLLIKNNNKKRLGRMLDESNGGKTEINSAETSTLKNMSKTERLYLVITRGRCWKAFQSWVYLVSSATVL